MFDELRSLAIVTQPVKDFGKEGRPASDTGYAFFPVATVNNIAEEKADDNCDDW